MILNLKKIISKNKTLNNNLLPFAFLKTGILNSIFGYSAYAFFLFLGLQFQISLFFATILGIFFNYVTFGRIVFKRSHKFSIFVKFLFVYLFVYYINILMLTFIKKILITDLYIAQFLCLTPIILLNWTLLNFWVFKKD